MGLPHHEGLPSSVRFSSYSSLPSTTRLHSDEGLPAVWDSSGLPGFLGVRCSLALPGSPVSTGSSATWDSLSLPSSLALRSFPAFALLKGPGGWASFPCPWFFLVWIPQKMQAAPTGKRRKSFPPRSPAIPSLSLLASPQAHASCRVLQPRKGR